MNESLERLTRALAARGLELPGSVGEEALSKASEALGFDVPAWAKSLYRRFDGAPLGEAGMAVLPLAQALTWAKNTLYAGPGALKLFFFAEEESDPLAQIVAGPLSGYVIRLAHDGGGPTLLFRNETELLDALHTLVDQRHESLDELMPTVGPELTNEADRAVGLAALSDEAVRGLDNDSRTLVREIATELVGPDDAQLSQLLADDDVYVREKAELVLRRRQDAGAQQLLALYAAEQGAFFQRCRSALEGAGWTVPASEDRDGPITWRSLSVGEPGRRIGLNLAAFFPQRHAPDFEQRLCERVRTMKEAKR